MLSLLLKLWALFKKINFIRKLAEMIGKLVSWIKEKLSKDEEETETAEEETAVEEEAGAEEAEAVAEEAGESKKGYTVKVDYIPQDLPCDSKEYFGAGFPTSVTIHWIGPYPGQTPEIARNWWVTGGGEASAHMVIKDKEALVCCPFDKVCWHCGDLYGNRSSIGIEVIPDNIEGKFSDASIATLKGVLDEYFPAQPLKRHYDWSGKDCPSYYVNEERWASLKEALGRA